MAESKREVAALSLGSEGATLELASLVGCSKSVKEELLIEVLGGSKDRGCSSISLIVGGMVDAGAESTLMTVSSSVWSVTNGSIE
ncbi:unnamed protein product, partial [Ilex paraguariensis]